MALMVSLFGVGKIHLPGSAESIDIENKTMEVLALILLSAKGHLSRDCLIYKVWPNKDAPTARRSLNTSLWRLRRALESSSHQKERYIISNNNDSISFNFDSKHWVDAIEFRNKISLVSKSPASSCAESDLSEIEQACMIYTGELLESIYSEPIVEHRNCMSEMYMMALKYLADAFLSRRNYEKSLHYLKKILSIDPLRENVHRDIMMVYYHQGLRAHAHAQYETCRSLLARELGVAPARETKILHDKILAEETSFELNPEIAGLESGSQMIEKYIEMKNKIRHLGQALAQAEEVCNSIMRDLGLADSEHIPFL